VKIISGANAPLIEKIIKEQIEITKNGGTHKPVKYGLHQVGDGQVMLLDTTEGGGTTTDEVQVRMSTTNLAERPAEPSRAPSLPQLSPNSTQTFALIKPDAMYPAQIESIIEKIRINKFHIVKMKKIWMTPDLVTKFYSDHVDKSYFQSLVTYFTAYFAIYSEVPL
jgi:hypothetical protein